MSKAEQRIQQAVERRAELWREFVANYQVVLITNPDGFSDYCAKFREKWLAA